MDKYRETAEKRLGNDKSYGKHKVHPEELARRAHVKGHFASKERDEFFDNFLRLLIIALFFHTLDSPVVGLVFFAASVAFVNHITFLLEVNLNHITCWLSFTVGPCFQFPLCFQPQFLQVQISHLFLFLFCMLDCMNGFNLNYTFEPGFSFSRFK